jgi:hypothetical protein
MLPARIAIQLRLVGALFFPAALVAQQRTPGPLPLGPVNGRISDSLYNPRTVRELRDGRVLVPNDRGDLLLADFATGAMKVLPDVRTGGNNNQLFALAGDSTLIKARTGWLFVAGTQALGMLPATNAVVTAASSLFGADINGFVLTVVGRRPEDSARAVRVSRSTGAEEPVTGLAFGPQSGRRPGVAFYDVSEQAVLALDGWIAVLRARPYRVDWRTPSGEWIHGAAIRIDTIPMDDRQKAAVLERDRPLQQRQQAPADIPNWPAFIEPFNNNALQMATPDGKALILRTSTADLPGNSYDVVNRRGEVERAITISATDKIVGVGLTSVYVWASRDGRTGHLERHPWP